MDNEEISNEDWKEVEEAQEYIQAEFCSVDMATCEIERLILKHRRKARQQGREELLSILSQAGFRVLIHKETGVLTIKKERGWVCQGCGKMRSSGYSKFVKNGKVFCAICNRKGYPPLVTSKIKKDRWVYPKEELKKQGDEEC